MNTTRFLNASVEERQLARLFPCHDGGDSTVSGRSAKLIEKLGHIVWMLEKVVKDGAKHDGGRVAPGSDV
jgi:hypothetical protein